MKTKIFTLALVAAIILPALAFSQSCKYQDYLDNLTEEGYTISADMGQTKVNLSQGQACLGCITHLLEAMIT